MIAWWTWPVCVAAVLLIAIPGAYLAAWIRNRPFERYRRWYEENRP